MCGRYTREYTWRQVHDFLDLRWPSPDPELPRSYNVAPTQASAIVRVDEDGATRLRVARWGLVPPWARDTGSAGRLINARAETVAGTPAFRSAYRRRRCVVPASAFYEWQAAGPMEQAATTRPEDDETLFGMAERPARSTPAKQPWYIHRADGAPLCFAGLWERWQGPVDANGEAPPPLETFTILTTAANAFMRPLHERMPVVLEPADVPAWLDAATPGAALDRLLERSAGVALTAHRVSARVGNPRQDDAALVVPIDPEGG